MPKGKRKGKFEHKRTEQAYSSDEDAGIDMTIDNCSETSGQSDLKSIHDEPDILSEPGARRRAKDRRPLKDIVEKEPEPEPQRNWWEKPPPPVVPPKTELEKLEEKILELIENLEARAATARATAFTQLRLALQRRSVFSLVAPRRITLASYVSRALRRGRNEERKAAAALVPILALQIGDEGTEEFLSEVRPALVAAATDKTASVETRTECCSSLAVLCLLLEEDLSVIIEVMRMYETIFSGSYLKGDGSLKVSGVAVEEGVLHAAALDGWAALLALLPDDHCADTLRNHQPTLRRLADMLEAVSLDVRVSAGGALAIAHECIRDVSGSSLDSTIEELLPTLQQLARDSHKYRAKRDRKIQRATFRDILKYFEEDETPELRVRVGCERVEAGTWAGAAAYALLAACLAGGLQALAPSSPALRAALRLAPAPPVLEPAPKRPQDKLQRHLANTAASKARTVARGKNRDKRSAALAL